MRRSDASAVASIRVTAGGRWSHWFSSHRERAAGSWTGLTSPEGQWPGSSWRSALLRPPTSGVEAREVDLPGEQGLRHQAQDEVARGRCQRSCRTRRATSSWSCGPAGSSAPAPSETTEIAKSPESTMIRTAWTAWSAARPRFHARSLARWSRILVLASGEPESVPTGSDVTETTFPPLADQDARSGTGVYHRQDPSGPTESAGAPVRAAARDPARSRPRARRAAGSRAARCGRRRA